MEAFQIFFDYLDTVHCSRKIWTNRKSTIFKDCNSTEHVLNKAETINFGCFNFGTIR